MSEETITIKLSEYRRLNEVDEFMDFLQAAGIDNWDGYELAQDAMKEQ
jgi:hypothetical protein